ncbi:unnamed protein product, partial [Heterosigma akashiwo]
TFGAQHQQFSGHTGNLEKGKQFFPSRCNSIVDTARSYAELEETEQINTSSVSSS